MMKQRPSGKRPTSQDVANLAGVSVTTVSFVINNKSGGNVRISEDTRKKVWAAVEALNYRPSSVARSLRTKRSNLLALMIPYIETPFQPQFAAAIQREAEKQNLDVFIYGTRDDLIREREFLNVLLSRAVDGVIIHSHHLSTDDIDNLVKAGISVVIQGNSPTHPLADNVMLDELKASEAIVTFLIRKGYRRIGKIAGPQTAWGAQLRKEGYLNALQNNGMPVESELIQEADFNKQRTGQAAMERLMTLSNPPDAVFCANDFLALGASLYTADAGLSVPDDVAIVGFDNTREAIMVRPKLTTVHKDVNALAAATLQLLQERINSNKPLPARRHILDFEIVKRDSA